VVFYPHTFVVGSGGQISFGISSNIANPAVSGWSSVIYLDANCNGALDNGENISSAPVAVSANQKICLLVKVFVPANAPYNAQDKLTLSASFDYVNASPALTGSQTRIDLTSVGSASDAGLKLSKSVDKSTARPGDTITYIIAYANTSSGSLSNLKIHDATPAYTLFNAASCGTLPTGLTACTVSTKPGAGSIGSVIWEFTGSLASGASGIVAYTVTVE